MTVCSEGAIKPCFFQSSTTMAIMTRHALEAFPTVGAQCVGARCPLIKPKRPLLEVESPRVRRNQSQVTNLMRKKPARVDSFEKKGQTWVAATELQSDLLVEVADMSFHLHKFPLLSRSGRLNRLVFESRDTEKDHIKMDAMPGGPETFEIAAKFCYGIPIDITPANVAALRCAAEYLEMTEVLEEGNLVSKTENFLSSEVLPSWEDSIKVLQTCERLLPWAEKLQIVKRCSESVAWKACTDPRGIRWSYSSSNESPSPPSAWNGLKNAGTSKLIPHDWWFADLALLNLESFKKVMDAIKVKGMRPDLIGSAISYYAHKWLPGLRREAVSTLLDNRGSPGDDDGSPKSKGSPTKEKKKKKLSPRRDVCTDRNAQESSGDFITRQTKHKEIVEGVVSLLPFQKDAVSVSSVLKLLRVANMLDVGLACKKELEKRAGMQLDEASLSDLLIPSFSHTSETLYDVDIIHRTLDCFLIQDHVQTTTPKEVLTSSGRDKNGDIYDGTALKPPVAPHTAKMKVAKLMDSYLCEVARDSKLPFSKFQALAEALPEFSRVTDDGLYRAIDTYLKAHPGLAEGERRKLCRIMDCQRLSLEACMHAAQNERLPLRIVVQVLFSEQLKLRNVVTGSLHVRGDHASDSPLQRESSAAPQQGNSAARGQPLNESSNTQMDIRALQQDVMFMKAKFAELQKDYLAVTHQVEKLTKSRGYTWTLGWRRWFHHKEQTESSSPSHPRWSHKEQTESSSPSHPRWSRPWRNSIS